MSVFKQKNAIASVEFKKFKGIDRKASHGDSSVAYDMSNFRILPDGSLMKREGFSPLSTTGSAYRGVWSGKLNGKVLTFVLQGATISKMYPEERSFTSIGKISTMTGTANFIPYNNRLYLYNQNAFYHITEDSVSIVDGYAPLYGKDWPSAKKGEVNEPLNLTSRHIRMTYIVDQNVPYLQVDHAISSIDAVYINNALVTDSSRYSLNRDMMYVSVSGLKINDRVSLFLTIDESELDKADLMSCKRTAAYGDYKDNILLFWDGNKKNTMFASCSIDNASLEEVTSVYPDTLPLYISANAIFKLPKQENYITAVCPQYDRLLIFTKEDTWMAQLSTSPQRALEAITVNPSYGCTSPGAAVMCGNEPICVSDGTILRWTSETDELNECNAYSISSKIDSMLPDSFFTNAIVLMDKKNSEIFFYDPSDTNGTLWIYNYDTDNWYKFDGIEANRLFLCEGRLGFIYVNSIFLFDKSLGKDILRTKAERSINAFYESHPTDFSVSGKKKRLCGMTLNATLSGNTVKAEYISDGEVVCSSSLKSDSSFPTSFIRRLNSRRFYYMSLRLLSEENSDQRIYSTSIWAKP